MAHLFFYSDKLFKSDNTTKMAVAIENPKYEELCRLCATKTTMELAIHIFEAEGTIRQISKKICTCLPIQVHQTDELPKIICETCLYKLELFCDFPERSVRTERLLVELYKELHTVRVGNEQSCVVPNVSLDHNELMMVQHHQLLTDHNLQVSDIDLAQLSQREGMIVEHEIILSHHTVDINSHSLDSIDLDNHELTNHDLSNQSLQTQEAIMTETNHHTMSDPQYTDNLNLLQQHQLLSDQFRLQHDVASVNMVDENSGNDINLTNGAKEKPFSKIVYKMRKSKLPTSRENRQVSRSSNIDYEDVKLEDSSLSVDSQLSNVHLQNNYENEKAEYNIDNPPYEDSNSDNSLLVSEHLKDVNVPNDKQVFDLNIENHSSIAYVNKDCFYCNICGKSCQEKSEFEDHYATHFYKCKICWAVFTNMDVLNSHRKQAHGASVDDPKPVKTRLKNSPSLNKNENDFKADSLSEESEAECDNSQLVEEEEVDDPGNGEDCNGDSKRKQPWSPKVCKECGKSYKTNYKLAEHMRKHTGEKPYQCKSCEKAFRSKIGLAQHEAKHTGTLKLTSSNITSNFTSELDNNSICRKGSMTIHAQHAEKVFNVKSYLMVHQRVHSDIKPYPCTTCSQNFKTKQSLLDHTNRHLGVKPYMCDICGRGFITKGLCRAHQKVHSGLDNRKYSCKICNKMFVSKSYLQTHLRIHTGEKPFMCEVCGKGFLTRVDLKIHSTMHTGEKSYVCEMCGKAFARRDALRCHRRSHTGERPYSFVKMHQYDIPRFVTYVGKHLPNLHLWLFIRLHTGERPYTCETCGKAFVSRSTMMSHAKKHVR
ncbi:hypothetical protein NQ317_017566 [Molorchus minor]|uniref:Uncharacterized protein n=1 Tax=Molorchus minor TaxID=1323400 RepID=A0ABQ9J803_9CUCU|nr:hypothetical protein NQ317_017566 [Molorchus minor]